MHMRKGISMTWGTALQSINRTRALLVIILVPTVIVLGYFMRVQRADDAYITYRYAQNLIRGNGFVFNLHENVLATTAPLHGLLLAALGTVFSDLPLVANVISFISACVLALLMFSISAQVGLPEAGVVSALLIATTVWTYSFAPLETIFCAAMTWAIIYFYLRRNLWGVSILGALALVTRADVAVLLVIIYLAHWLDNRQLVPLLKYALITIAIVLPWFAFAYFTYGSPLPNSALAKSNWEGHLLTFSMSLWPKILKYLILDYAWLSAVVVGCALIGLIEVMTHKRYRRIWIVPAWMTAYTVSYTVIRIAYPFSWYYYPIVCGVIFLAGFGITVLLRWVGKRIDQKPFLQSGWRVVVALVFALVTIVQVRSLVIYSFTLPVDRWVGGRDSIYRMVARWLAENTLPTDAVAAHEVGTIGYYSDRKIIDLLGLVTPQVADHVKLDDYEWAIEHYQPAYVIVHDRPKNSVPASPPWFKRTYGLYRLVQSFETEAYPFAIDIYQRGE